ncbi:LysR family transcriptional regulator [Bordetella sp. BOR01]|uniref:LysR family transcriptional regulator n=1 Tax=Bordetella sp. BOR01 TaxID=2854779 RepID=UPI002103A8C3|nr:LysR family transcriptional regulator [Bordetella sp. BOR01]
MNVSMRQLMGFLLVARLGSFTRAAEQMHITQAGLSAMVRDLEVQFGCRLFDRTTRSVSLTREGTGLVPAAERIVNELEAAAAMVRATTASARRILTVAVTPIVASSLMPLVCRVHAGRDPGVEVRMRDVPQPAIQGLVERGEVDVGFSIFLKPAAGIEVQSLLSFQLVCIAPRGMLGDIAKAGQRGELAWSALPPHKLIGLPADTLIQQAMDSYLARVGRANEPRPVCNSMQTIIGMVAAGHGMAILPSMVLPSCPAEAFDVAYMTDPVAPLPFYQIAKKGHQLPEMVQPFVATLAEVIKSLCSR